MASTAAEAAAQPAAEQQQANGSGEQKTRHSEVGHKSLLKSDDLYQVRALPISVHPFLVSRSSSFFSIWSEPDWGISLPRAVHPGDERVPARAGEHEGAP